MRNQVAETYVYKYDRPFTAWLFALALDGTDDEFGSVDEFGYWVARMGKYVLIEDSNGACYSIRALPTGTGPAFYAWADEYFGADRMAEYMNADAE